jgi:hypothetical protein
MNCSQCGHEAPEGANACPNCGASLATAAPPGASAAPPGAGSPMPVGATPAASGSGAPGFAFDINRLTRVERIIGGATIVLLISLFLPWDKYSETETLNGVTSSSASVSFSGYSLHGYLWIVFILSLAVIGFLVAKAGFATMPFALPVSEDQALLVATAISFILVLIGFLLRSYGGSTSSAGLGYSYHAGWSYSWGSFVSLIAAVVAVVPLGRPAIQKQMNKG